MCVPKTYAAARTDEDTFIDLNSVLTAQNEDDAGFRVTSRYWLLQVAP